MRNIEKVTKDREDLELDRLKYEYSTLMKATANLKLSDDEESTTFLKERNDFETEFVRLNCEVQNNRSEIHQMKDTISFNQKHILVSS